MVTSRLLMVMIVLGYRVGQAQSRYEVHFIDFKNEANATFCKTNTDGLGVILADGYLNGRLKAYKFSGLAAHMLAIESSIEGRPKKWNRKLPAGITVNEPFDMMEAEALQPATSKKLLIADKIFLLPPAAGDTLSKEEFLDEMILEEFDPPSPWNKEVRYQVSDMVSYKTNRYTALLDTAGVAPTNTRCWELSYKGVLPFYSPVTGLNGISIIGSYHHHGRDSTWQPQLIRLRMSGEWKGILQDTDITFLFEDVIRYLNATPQPILWDHPLGYIGNGLFVLGPSEEASLRKWLRRKLAASSPLRKKVVIKNEALFRRFLSGEYEDVTYPPWHLSQHVASKAIHIFRNDTLFTTLPLPSIQPLLEKEPTRAWFTYSEALSKDILFGYRADFLATINQTGDAAPTEGRALSGDYFYSQKYFLETQKFQPDTILSFIKPVLAVITKAFDEGILHLAQEKNSVYPAKYDWSKIETVRAMGLDIKKEYWVNLLHDDLSQVTYPRQTDYYDNHPAYLLDTLRPPPADTLQFAITYQRYYSSTSKKDHVEVSQIAFRDMRGYSTYAFPEYTFDWNDVKPLLQKEGSPALLYFIDRLEKGEVMSPTSKSVYGICELPR